MGLTFLTEAFLGGVAALRITRYKGQGLARMLSGSWGYGLYFTDSRLIGVSYTKYLPRAYIPFWLLTLVWIVTIASSVAWGRLTNSENLPPWSVLLWLGSMISSLVFLFYASPKLASHWIQSKVVRSTMELEDTAQDVIFQASDISEIDIQYAKVYDDVRQWVPGSVITVSLKTGQTIIFANTLNKEKFGQLLQLFQNFCSLNPSIKLSVK